MTGERKRLYQPVEDFLRSIRSVLPAKPTAIPIATAHWKAAVPGFTGAGRPELAAQASALLRKAGDPAEVDPHHGWDHGVFIPLKVMFPDADIPVVACSSLAPA